MQDDEGTYGLAVTLRRDAGYLYVLDALHLVEELLDFAWVDVLTPTDNHILDAARDAIVAVFVLHAEVARMEESVLVDDFGGGFGVLVVTLHRIVATVAHFALHTHGTFFARFGVDDTHFGKLIVTAYGGATHFERVVHTGVGHTRRCFGQTIHAGYLHEHLFFYLTHQLNRTQGTCHDAHTEAGHVEHIEHRMVQFGDEHGRHAIYRRTTFLMDGG